MEPPSRGASGDAENRGGLCGCQLLPCDKKQYLPVIRFQLAERALDHRGAISGVDTVIHVGPDVVRRWF